VDDSGKTALSRAASAGQTNMVALLLDYKADPNFRSPKDTPPGWTPLHDAVDNGQKDSVAMLLQRGADPNARAGLFSWPEQRGASGRGYTPVLMATRKGHESIVETLLRFKADPNTASASGDTPLLTTLDGNHPLAGERVRIFKMLLDHGANPNMPSPHGNTPLILSSIYGEKELVQALIAHKADLDAKNDEGKSALHFLTSGTVNGTFVEIAALLLDAGANPNVQDNGASTPLAYLNRRPTPGIPVGSVGPAESATAKSQMVELLHQHGAVADVPDFTSIRLTRKGGSTATVFRQSTNGMNHFTLFQTIATYYEEPGAHSGYVPGGVLSVCGFYPFPDLPRLKVHRPVKGKLTETQEFPVYVLTETNTFDCAKDTPLEFGDIVEIPEREHGLTEAIVGPTRDQSQSLRTCLARTVTVKVKAGSVELPGASVGVGNCLRELLKQPQVQKLLTSASDLTHVKVTRSEAGGKKREIVENVQVFWDGKAQTWEDVWLRNGDVIEVPDKTELSEKSR